MGLRWTQEVRKKILALVEPFMIPRGGTEGDLLTRGAGDDYDADWAVPSGSLRSQISPTTFYLAANNGTIDELSQHQLNLDGTLSSSTLATNSGGEITLSPDVTETLIVTIDVTIAEK